MGNKKDPNQHFQKKTAAERLKELGIIQGGNPGEMELSGDRGVGESETNNIDDFHAAQTATDNFLGASINQKNLLKPANADMMQRVRTTAKWSQLYKSGSTFPPKHKVLFINQDDENAEDTEIQSKPHTGEGQSHTGARNAGRQGADIDAVSPGTYRNQIQNDFDEVGRLIDASDANNDGKNKQNIKVVQKKNNEAEKKNIMLTLHKPDLKKSQEIKDTFRVGAVGDS